MSGNLKREVLKKKWEGIIKGRYQSPLSFESYVQSHQISKSNFYKWQRRLKASSTAPSLSFLELPALTEAPQPEVFSLEVGVAKGGCVKVNIPFAKVIELVKALL